MACAPVQSGNRFLEATLSHIDCQAQAIGSYGYGALADPTSSMSIVLTGVLVIFVAIFGIRVATGHTLGGQDLFGDAVRVVIVLTLAMSWPAWRTIGYDVLINGPAELSQAIGLASGLPGTQGDMVQRLQRIDDGFATLYEIGSGRRGVANGDWFQLGFARSAFLAGTLGPLALLKLGAGILLALAPLIAGFLLFGTTRSIFAGWAKGLVAVFLATVFVTLLLAAELALLEPWQAGVLTARAASAQTLGAPMEGLVVTLAFAVIALCAIFAMFRMVFSQASTAIRQVAAQAARGAEPRGSAIRSDTIIRSDRSERSRTIAAAVAGSLDRDVRLGRGDVPQSGLQPAPASAGRGGPEHIQRAHYVIERDALGSSYRRSRNRASQASARRDQAR